MTLTTPTSAVAIIDRKIEPDGAADVAKTPRIANAASRPVGKFLGVVKHDGYIVVSFGTPAESDRTVLDGVDRHVVTAFAGRRDINRPRHAVCWTCRPTGRTDRPIGLVCKAEDVALAHLDELRYRDR